MPSLGDLVPEVSDDFQSADLNPQAANAAVAAAQESIQSEFPQPVPPTSDLVELPGGLDNGTDVIRTVRFKELTGADEEALARASVSLYPFHFVNTLIECGVVNLGDEPKSRNKELLKQILVGDRDAIILGIRRATYGDEIELTNWVCPNCKAEE